MDIFTVQEPLNRADLVFALSSYAATGHYIYADKIHGHYKESVTAVK